MDLKNKSQTLIIVEEYHVSSVIDFRNLFHPGFNSIFTILNEKLRESEFTVRV